MRYQRLMKLNQFLPSHQQSFERKFFLTKFCQPTVTLKYRFYLSVASEAPVTVPMYMNSLYFGRYGSWVFQCTSGGWFEEMCTLLLFHIRFNCTTKSALLKIAVILENQCIFSCICHHSSRIGIWSTDLLIKKILCFFLIIWPYNPFFPQNSLDHSRLFIPNKHDTVEFFLKLY